MKTIKNFVEMIKERVTLEAEDFEWKAVAVELMILAILPIMIQ